MAKRNALGKGLGSLLSEATEAYKNEFDELGFNVSDIRLIEIATILPNPHQPRKKFDENAMQELADSIREHGLIQPVVVIKKGVEYILVAGERRLRASKMLGETQIKAVILDAPESKLRELALIENIQREDLNPIELAHSYRDLIKSLNLTQDALARYIHKSRPQITNTLRLLELDERTQDMISQGKITQSHAKVLVGLGKDDEKTLVNTIVGQKLNVANTEKIVQKIKKREKMDVDLSADMQEEFKKLSDILSKNDIKFKIKNTQITLYFGTADKIKLLNSLFA